MTLDESNKLTLTFEYKRTNSTGLSISQNLTATEKCTFSAFPIHKPKGIKEVKINPGSSRSSRVPAATKQSVQWFYERKSVKVFTINGHEGRSLSCITDQ